jgi:hypothetical protein
MTMLSTTLMTDCTTTRWGSLPDVATMMTTAAATRAAIATRRRVRLTGAVATAITSI